MIGHLRDQEKSNLNLMSIFQHGETNRKGFLGKNICFPSYFYFFLFSLEN
jgi:hypothetical protein